VQAYLIGLTLGLSTNELLATEGEGKNVGLAVWKRAGSRARARVGVAVWVAGKRRGVSA